MRQQSADTRLRLDCWDNAVAESVFATPKRAHLPSELEHPGRAPRSYFRIHRGLLQPTKATFICWLPEPWHRVDREHAFDNAA
jgi:hypothetical protein